MRVPTPFDHSLASLHNTDVRQPADPEKIPQTRGRT